MIFSELKTLNWFGLLLTHAVGDLCCHALSLLYLLNPFWDGLTEHRTPDGFIWWRNDIFSPRPPLQKGKQHHTVLPLILPGCWYHPSKRWKRANLLTLIIWVQRLVCRDYISYQNCYEADQKGNEEDPNAIEMHRMANRATQGLRLVGGHGYFRVHQETSVGRKGTASAPAVTHKQWGCFRETREAYPCFWLKFW